MENRKCKMKRKLMISKESTIHMYRLGFQGDAVEKCELVLLTGG